MERSIHIQAGSVPPPTKASPVFPKRFAVIDMDTGQWCRQFSTRQEAADHAEELEDTTDGRPIEVVDLLKEAMGVE